MAVTRTKEAVDDAEQAAHGADHRGNHLIPTISSQIARIQWLGTDFTWRRSQFKGQRLQSRRHGDRGVMGKKEPPVAGSKEGNGSGKGREALRLGNTSCPHGSTWKYKSVKKNIMRIRKCMCSSGTPELFSFQSFLKHS